jgi:type I phosphodiesterase/nucleotide pyrophosphatase/phosphopentomutase/2,3-bisphosphoglycerate-independent phosphoglycerate mutase family metalloenzyme
MRRVVLVLADGLRPDAITPTDMPSLDALARQYTVALRASTVRPSRTVAALASLATGVAPATHGLIEPGLGFLARLPGLRPLAHELSRGGVASHVVASELLPAERAVLWALSKAAGLGTYRSAGLRAREVARAAQAVALSQSTGLVFVCLNDCDQAGHAHGWMSPQYRSAAVEIDAAIGVLAELSEHALLIVMADHGGGGVTTHDHAEPHPINDHIPLILAGPDVTRRHQLTRHVSLLDIPPTLLWWFGLNVPVCYEGRVLTQAFTRTSEPVAAVV